MELDDDLVDAVMQRFGPRTKREAVQLALERLVGGSVMSVDEQLEAEGIGWDGGRRPGDPRGDGRGTTRCGVRNARSPRCATLRTTGGPARLARCIRDLPRSATKG
ncbi:MAG: type II toxin-antitoxin system VapB family antitoxin [Actinomycetota bacterium]